YHTHNVSAILRSCECFGVQRVHLIQEEDDPADFLASQRISRGSAQWLSLQKYPDFSTCLNQLRADGMKLVSLSPHAEKTLHEVSLDHPLALLFGTEWEGVSGDALTATDELVRIPMFGFTESFNVSVTVALCLQTLIQRIHQQDFRLSGGEQETLMLEWTRTAIRHNEAIEKRFWEDFNG
ncbi:MAG: RNA methyltransferase, partial [Bacteroidota bacterium]